jgi:EAL domain-containing protein (putative c-di-GMP-specific phosphodiesterase class I)
MVLFIHRNATIERLLRVGLCLEHHDLDIVKAIIFISKSMKLQVIAEGIEQKEQFDLLKELGCHYMQGYYVSRPLPADKIIHYFGDTINKRRST